jgi:tetratricopeptide (TPR) repeat protein
VRADPGFSKARAGQAELFFAAAFVSQDYAEALQINWLDAYEAMKLRLATLPDDLPAVTVLEARLALRRYDLDAAVELARMAMRAAPGDAETHLVLAEVLAFHGEAEGALEAARTALALNPGRPSAALAAQGLAHFAGGDLLAARDAMEAAVGAAEVPPARDLALLAAVQALAGANEEARATLDRYVAALEDRPRRLWRLAEALPANPRAMTWMRPGLAEAMATFPFREARVVDRLAQGLVAAGIARAGLGYYRLDARLRLDGNDVQALVFGREIAGRGAPEPFSAWRQTRTQEGALFQPSRFGPTILGREGRSAVVGDALCDAWRAGDTDLTSCGLIFRIDDTIPLPGAYVVTTELRVFAFDPG